jgi:hypothetical protein
MDIPDFMPIPAKGWHQTPKSGACIMEMASFLAGETWSDRPRCVDSLLAGVSRTINDLCDDETRSRLFALLPRLMGTKIWDPQDVAKSAKERDKVHGLMVDAVVQFIQDKGFYDKATMWGTNTHGHFMVQQFSVSAIHAIWEGVRETDSAHMKLYHDMSLVSGVVRVCISNNIPLDDLLVAMLDAYDKATGRDKVEEPTEEKLRELAELIPA